MYKFLSKSVAKYFAILTWAIIYNLQLSAQDSLRTLSIGADYAYYPYEFVNEVHEPDGFDIDIIKAIGRELNMKLEIKAGNWFNIKKDLEEGKLDLIAGMYYLPDRAEKVNFSMPYIIITHSIFVKEGDYWQSLKDVKDQSNLKVVVENSSILHKYLTTAGISTNRILPVENQLDALKILTETPNTCALLPDLQGKYIAYKNGFDNIVTVGLPILPREYSIAVNKSDTLLLSKINDAITKINKNGTYEKIYYKWFGLYDKKEKRLINLSNLELILLLLVVIILGTFIYWILKTQKLVQFKTEELNRELHEKQKLNNELLKNETILRKITENTPFPIAMLNAEGFFIYVNRRFEDEFGYTRKEIYNLDHMIKLFFPDKEYQKEVKSKLEEKILLLIENLEYKNGNSDIFNLIDKDKTIIKVIIQIISLGDGQVLFFFENVSERIKNENNLKEAKKRAESADKLKSSFLANISHEIRTPMNSILGFSSLLAEDDVNLTDKRTYSNLIRKNGNILLLLIQDIIDFSKIEAGELSIYPQIIDLKDAIDDTYRTIKEDFSVKIPKIIQFKLSLPTDVVHTKYYIRVDANRLSQVLINLLNNAFKYTDKGIIEYGFYEIENHKLRIFIQDTGIGINKEEQKYIFNRFSRVEGQSSIIRGGTGLGLAISYQILKLFGSELHVESEIGKGSRFYFDLNFYEGQGEKVDLQLPPAHIKTAIDYDWSEKTILIVEDNKENANYLEAALKKTNCRLIVKMDGLEAKNTLESKIKIDLVLLDWMLPEIDGEGILKIIRKEHKGIPVIVVTALAMVDDKMKILGKQVNAYFAKPVDKGFLLDKINQLMFST